MKTPAWTPILVALACSLLAGCDFEAPLTATATQKVNPQLLGNWRESAPEPGLLTIRQLDDSRYIATIDGDAYLIHHSDLAGRALVSARDLNDPARKYCYYLWSLSPAGQELKLSRVNPKALPATLPTPAAAEAALRDALENPQLFDQPTTFIRQKR